MQNVQVVVDQGGGVGTHAAVDAAAAAGVKLWQVLGTGMDHVDVDYIAGRGLPLANTPGPYQDAVGRSAGEAERHLSRRAGVVR
jgi:lactate dehydrogenase-like 2-hydroxyacid dehydrogenase